ncbi:glycosyl hydrolase [Pochonia chlamydosporia 170]|uniref:Glycosyl hydrolase n=1 Tax=Pochonia chlamydosporia 170 TaxID=1380566 RepID=A0A179FVC0_METCM|nr:glycosyl hydrolase [Pochonia chlamydosporia 170]OAQ69023.1 glycosyl hydrolase [Pochonia chlamydosporia 170]
MTRNHYQRTPLLVAAAICTAMSGIAVEAASAQTYTNNAVLGIKALNANWYNVRTGIWDNAWWNSANALTTLADFAAVRLDEANKLNIGGYMRNTFVQAQKTNVQTVKNFDTGGMVSSVYCLDNSDGCLAKRDFLGKRGFDDFLNEFYDDEGWWALAWLKSYDVAGDKEYLQAAIDIFKDMQTGRDTNCGGGIWWSKKKTYVASIANELYLSVAASLARRVPQNSTYKKIAIDQWNWFEKTGLINSKKLINDGLTNPGCKNNGLQTWSYNQGVILGGLAELFRLTGDLKYIEKAMPIAEAAIKTLSVNGTLVETDKCELRTGHCGRDGQQFKGIFIRNLRYLNDVAPKQEFKDFIKRNADSIWAKDRNNENLLGVAWTGPYIAATGPSHSSALDAIVAAVAVA